MLRAALRRLMMIGIGLAMLGAASPAARAGDCVLSNGKLKPEGAMVYNQDYKVVQYCDGTRWRTMLGGGIVDPALADLTDVDDALAPADGNVLTYDSASGGWTAGTAGIGVEDDPQVGAVTDDKWCVGDGTAVQCDQDPPTTAATAQIQTFTSSGTWNKPAGLQYVAVEIWGGGGGGAGTTCDDECSRPCACSCQEEGGGGGAGAYARKVIPASSLGATVTVTVGAAGTAGGSNGNGGSGGNSSFGGFVTANGGGGGTNTGTYGTNGTASGGDINFAGLVGHSPHGGASGDTYTWSTSLLTNGNTSTTLLNAFNGKPGLAPGGGGSRSRAAILSYSTGGGTASCSNNRSGGAGASGRVIVTSHIQQ